MKRFLYSSLSLSIFFILWEIGYRYLGDLVLPSVFDTFKMFLELLKDPEVLENMLITLKRIFVGLGASILIASLLGVLAGMQSIDKELLTMAESFNLSLKTKLLNIYFPHIFSFIFPAWLTAIGLSWKIVMMAELISSDDGMGSLLATARSHIDTTSVMALLVLMVSLLILFERLILDSLKQRLESWRK